MTLIEKSKLIITLYYKFKIKIYIVDDLLNPNLFYHLILKYDALNKETFHLTINNCIFSFVFLELIQVEQVITSLAIDAIADYSRFFIKSTVWKHWNGKKVNQFDLKDSCITKLKRICWTYSMDKYSRSKMLNTKYFRKAWIELELPMMRMTF